MFGNPNRPMPSTPAPPLGGGASATGAFSLPKGPSMAPPPKSSGPPGSYTQMMSASALPTLGQPPAQPMGQAAPQAPLGPPKAKSMVPLYIVGGALLLAIILIVLFFLMRH